MTDRKILNLDENDRIIYELLNDIDSEHIMDKIACEKSKIGNNEKARIKESIIDSINEKKVESRKIGRKKYDTKKGIGIIVASISIILVLGIFSKQNIYAVIESTLNSIQTKCVEMFGLGSEADRYAGGFQSDEKYLPGGASVKIDKILIYDKKIYVSILASLPYDKNKAKDIYVEGVEFKINGKRIENGSGSMGIFFVKNIGDKDQIFDINCEYLIDEDISESVVDIDVNLDGVKVFEEDKKELLDGMRKAIRDRNLNMMRKYSYNEPLYESDSSSNGVTLSVKNVDIGKLRQDTKIIKTDLNIGGVHDKVKINEIRMNKTGVQFDVGYNIEKVEGGLVFVVENDLGDRIKMMSGGGYGDNLGNMSETFSSVGSTVSNEIDSFMKSKYLKVSGYIEREDNKMFSREEEITNSIDDLSKIIENVEKRNICTPNILGESLPGMDEYYSMDTSNFRLVGSTKIDIR